MKLYLLETRQRKGKRWSRWAPMDCIYWEKHSAKEAVHRLTQPANDYSKYRVTTWKKER